VPLAASIEQEKTHQFCPAGRAVSISRRLNGSTTRGFSGASVPPAVAPFKHPGSGASGRENCTQTAFWRGRFQLHHKTAVEPPPGGGAGAANKRLRRGWHLWAGTGYFLFRRVALRFPAPSFPRVHNVWGTSATACKTRPRAATFLSTIAAAESLGLPKQYRPAARPSRNGKCQSCAKTTGRDPSRLRIICVPRLEYLYYVPTECNRRLTTSILCSRQCSGGPYVGYKKWRDRGKKGKNGRLFHTSPF